MSRKKKSKATKGPPNPGPKPLETDNGGALSGSSGSPGAASDANPLEMFPQAAEVAASNEMLAKLVTNFESLAHGKEMPVPEMLRENLDSLMGGRNLAVRFTRLASIPGSAGSAALYLTLKEQGNLALLKSTNKKESAHELAAEVCKLVQEDLHEIETPELLKEMESLINTVSSVSETVKSVPRDQLVTTKMEYLRKALNDMDFNDQKEHIMEFDATDMIQSMVRNETGPTPHRILGQILLTGPDEARILPIFLILASLADPMTQPSPQNKCIISIDTLSDILIALCYPKGSPLAYFDLAMDLCAIVTASLRRLNCFDQDVLDSINNADENIDWHENMAKWLPSGFNFHNLELLYMVDILAVYTIFKLYRTKPIFMNPFLGFFIKMWKLFTSVLLLGLEVDRREEEGNATTPTLVRAVIRGTSAVRSVLATIINNYLPYKKHDFEHEPFNVFMSPHGRKLATGALYADMRAYAATLLALGHDLSDVTGLLSDLQPGDRYDEDVKYMFEYEFDDYNEVFDDDDVDWDALDEMERERERIKEKRGYYKRCNCIFDDDDYVVEKEPETERSVTPQLDVVDGRPLAVKNTDRVDFDGSGKDWRDIPRGENVYYSKDFEFLENIDLGRVENLFRLATQEALDDAEGQYLVQVIATYTKAEQEAQLWGETSNNEDERPERLSSPHLDSFDSDFIYKQWCKDDNFEKMLHANPKLVWCMMDEMLMSYGYRRVLIWFITHLEINYRVIIYIYELIMGTRGTTTDQKEFRFSRQGSIQLSEVEISMLLQEFFTNAAIFFSNKLRDAYDEEGKDEDDEDVSVSPYLVGLMRLVCLLVNSLIDKKKLKDTEYVFELQTLLMSWVGICKEAKDLFFRLKDEVYDNAPPSSPPTLRSEAPEKKVEEQTQNEYASKLMSLLPPTLNDDNDLLSTLRSFVGKHSIAKATPVFGRKVLYSYDEILPMWKTDMEQEIFDYWDALGITDELLGDSEEE